MAGPDSTPLPPRLIGCFNCGRSVAAGTSRCPHCGAQDEFEEGTTDG